MSSLSLTLPALPVLPEGFTPICTIGVRLFRDEATGMDGAELLLPEGQPLGLVQLLGALETAKQVAIQRFGGLVDSAALPRGE